MSFIQVPALSWIWGQAGLIMVNLKSSYRRYPNLVPSCVPSSSFLQRTGFLNRPGMVAYGIPRTSATDVARLTKPRTVPYGPIDSSKCSSISIVGTRAIGVHRIELRSTRLP